MAIFVGCWDQSLRVSFLIDDHSNQVSHRSKPVRTAFASERSRFAVVSVRPLSLDTPTVPITGRLPTAVNPGAAAGFVVRMANSGTGSAGGLAFPSSIEAETVETRGFLVRRQHPFTKLERMHATMISLGTHA